jgi:TonB family protein
MAGQAHHPEGHTVRPLGSRPKPQLHNTQWCPNRRIFQNTRKHLPGSGNLPGSGVGDGGEDFPGGSDSAVRSLPLPPKPKPEKPRPMSEGVMEAALLNKVQPQYPEPARLMHIAGTVRLQAIIGKDGRVRDVEVLSGNPILAHAALAAVREWRYRPTELNHEIVEVETEITVNFILQQ